MNQPGPFPRYLRLSGSHFREEFAPAAQTNMNENYWRLKVRLAQIHESCANLRPTLGGDGIFTEHHHG